VPIHDVSTWAAVTAERSFLAALEAGCSAPVAALAEVREGRLEMRALSATEDGSTVRRVSGTGDPERPHELGERLADEVRRLDAASVR
jgi:hydroxymethylbilane synthase